MTDFEALLVVDWYLELEERLHSVLQTTLYTEQTKDIFLPPLAGIIVDAASLIDTIFRDAYEGDGERTRFNITHFCKEFEPKLKLSNARSLLYQIPLVYIEPFRSWFDQGTGSYRGLTWWSDYNRLKHDRIKEYKCATLSNAIHALCGLQQVLSPLERFKYPLLKRNLICFGQWGKRFAFEEAYRDSPKHVTILVETSLFATPVGVNRFPDDVKHIRPFHFSSGRKLWRFVGPDF